MTQRTSRGHLTSICKRLKRAKRWADLQTCIASEDFTAALVALDPTDRGRALRFVADACARFGSAASIPASGTMRVRWDAAMVARLKEAARRHRNDHVEVARELRIPKETARFAIWKHVRQRESVAAPHLSQDARSGANPLRDAPASGRERTAFSVAPAGHP